jgi:hypothetical protein
MELPFTAHCCLWLQLLQQEIPAYETQRAAGKYNAPVTDLINSNFPLIIYSLLKEVSETTELLQLRWDKIFFTGSPKVGKIVYEAAAKNLVPVVLELGGKSPASVTKTADLEVAAKRLVWGQVFKRWTDLYCP